MIYEHFVSLSIPKRYFIYFTYFQGISLQFQRSFASVKVMLLNIYTRL